MIPTKWRFRTGARQGDVLAIADACLCSLKALACSAFADYGEMLQGEGGDSPEDVWDAFRSADQDATEVRERLHALYSH
jgi:hypothetical protein